MHSGSQPVRPTIESQFPATQLSHFAVTPAIPIPPTSASTNTPATSLSPFQAQSPQPHSYPQLRMQSPQTNLYPQLRMQSPQTNLYPQLQTQSPKTQVQMPSSHQLQEESPQSCQPSLTHSAHECTCPDPFPLRNLATDKALASTEMNREVLVPVDVVLKKYGHLIKNGASEGNVWMLTVRLGKEVMRRYTPGVLGSYLVYQLKN